MQLPTTIDLESAGVFTFHDVIGDKAIYHGASHDDTARQTLEFIRTEPKRSGKDFGVRRGYIRFTTDREVTYADDTTGLQPDIETIAFNWHVGKDQDPDAIVRAKMIKVLRLFDANDELEVEANICNPSALNFLLLVRFFSKGEL